MFVVYVCYTVKTLIYNAQDEWLERSDQRLAPNIKIIKKSGYFEYLWIINSWVQQPIQCGFPTTYARPTICFDWFPSNGPAESSSQSQDQFLLRRFKWLKTLPHPRSRTVLVEGIPEDFTCEDKVMTFGGPFFFILIEHMDTFRIVTDLSYFGIRLVSYSRCFILVFFGVFLAKNVQHAGIELIFLRRVQQNCDICEFCKGHAWISSKHDPFLKSLFVVDHPSKGNWSILNCGAFTSEYQHPSTATTFAMGSISLNLLNIQHQASPTTGFNQCFVGGPADSRVLRFGVGQRGGGGSAHGEENPEVAGPGVIQADPCRWAERFQCCTNMQQSDKEESYSLLYR